MGKCVAKLADDEYVEWSTVVDAPITYICNREEMKAHLLERYGTAGRPDERIARADKRGTSWIDREETMEDLVALNRAGDDETELTLGEIREQYRAPEGAAD